MLVQVLWEADTEMGWKTKDFIRANTCMREDGQLLKRLGELSDYGAKLTLNGREREGRFK